MRDIINNNPISDKCHTNNVETKDMNGNKLSDSIDSIKSTDNRNIESLEILSNSPDNSIYNSDDDIDHTDKDPDYFYDDISENSKGG